MTSAQSQDIALQDLDLEGQANSDTRVNGHAIGNTNGRHKHQTRSHSKARRRWHFSFQNVIAPVVGNLLPAVSIPALRHLESKKKPFSPLGLETSQHRGSFLKSLNSEIIKGQHERFVDACNWYTRYLTQQFHTSWASLFQEIWTYPPEGNRAMRAPNEEDLTKFFQSLVLVAGKLSDKDTALVTIVDDLYNATHLPFIKMGSSGNAGEEEDGYDDVDQERNTGRAGAQQLSFAVIGWINLLYQAKPLKPPEMLEYVEIHKAYEDANSPPKDRRRTLYGEGSHRRSRRARGSTSYRRNLDVDEIDQDLSTFLSFGKIVPEYLKDSLSAHDSNTSGTPSHEMIEVSNVCYHTLNKVADIKIRWVHDMTAHLQFDSRTKVLNIFQYPSACLILDSFSEKTLLHRLLKRHEDPAKPGAHDTSDYFRELLLTFRIIFGQDKRSWQIPKNYPQNPSDSPDPLLELFCGRNWRDPQILDIYDDLDDFFPPRQYSSATFPFFGRRLVELQNYIESQNPNTFWALWHDRRNVSRWWTFWAVIIIGVPTLLLSLVSTVMQGVQIDLAKQQVRLG